MPERDSTETVRRLEPVIRDPELAKKIENAAPVGEAPQESFFDDSGDGPLGPERGGRRRRAPGPTDIDNSPLAHVVGVILGSPEFQRR